MNTGECVKYCIPGDPVPLARARFGRGRTWDSQKELKTIWGIYVANIHDGRPLYTGPLHLDVTFFMPIPPSYSKKKANAVNGTHHVFVPDLTNMAKFVEDVCTGILYQDDRFIARITTAKIYSHDPHTEFFITEIVK